MIRGYAVVALDEVFQCVGVAVLLFLEEDDVRIQGVDFVDEVVVGAELDI